MIAQRLIFSSGIIVAIMPFLGFPSSVDTFFYALIGLFVAGISFLLRDFTKPIKFRSPKKEQESAFMENEPVLSVEKKRNFKRKPPKETLSTASGASSMINDITPPQIIENPEITRNDEEKDL